VLIGAPMAPSSPELPSLIEPQAEALDAIHFYALKHSIKLRLKTGDILFVNNLAVLHCRTAFRDGERDKRHMLRLWLNNPGKAWQIPPALQLE
jgi:Taurine catabolism dioxygenase TauD, TfdA family